MSSITTRMPWRSLSSRNSRDAFDALVAHQLGDAFDHARLVHLIGNLGDDDRFAVLADLFDLELAPASGSSRGPRASAAARGVAPDDECAGGEIGSRHDLGQRLRG